MTLKEFIEKAKERRMQMTKKSGGFKLYMFFPAWKVGTEYKTNQHIHMGETIYRVMEDHTSVEGKDPGNTPELYAEINMNMNKKTN